MMNLMLLLLLSWTAAEWGVMKYDCGGTWKLSAGPSEGLPVFVPVGDGGTKPVVKEPVLYIYGEIPASTSFRVLVPDSSVVYSRPEHTLRNGMPEWVIRPATAGSGVGGFDYYDREASLVNIKTPSGMDIWPYIVYEVKVTFINPVRARRVAGGVFFYNLGPQPIQKAYYLGDGFWCESGEIAPYGVAFAPLNEGEPGASALVEDMKGLGFTPGAAGAFADTWWKEVSDKPGSIFYQLPGSEASRLVPVEWSPEPEKFTRGFWVWVEG